MKQLLEAGVHFGHQTKRWNPKMKPYIFGARNGIYIIDLQQTVKMFREAYDFVRNIAAQGGKVLFVGTKKQAQEAIKEEAERAGIDYVCNRWIGGLMTNFQTISNSIRRYNELTKLHEAGSYNTVTKKEALMMDRERLRLDKNVGGICNMKGAPAVLFVVDTNKEAIAIQEAKNLGIPVVAVLDTNCDPDNIDVKIPGNDDAIRAIKLFSSSIANAYLEGKAQYEESLAADAEDKEEVKEEAGTKAASTDETASA